MIEICPTCEGKGYGHDGHCLHKEPGVTICDCEKPPCPDCDGRGSTTDTDVSVRGLIPEELVRVVVEAWTELGWEQLTWSRQNAYKWRAERVLSRLLEGAETVKWCEKHKASAWQSASRCLNAMGALKSDWLEDCRIVERPLLATEATIPSRLSNPMDSSPPAKEEK